MSHATIPGANCVNSMMSKNWGIWCRCCNSFATAKSFARHFLLVLKILLKMTIVQMRQDNGAPGTCRQSELHFVMDR